MRVHLLFEQSGTFKNEFKKLGYDAYDYDLDNQFNETDFQLDLFEEIENAYLNKKTIFDNFKKNDLIFAFFPCTYFSSQNNMIYSGTAMQMRNMNDSEKQEYILDRVKNRDYNLNILNKLIQIIKNRDLKLIVENPYHNNFLLSQDGFKSPEIIITDRTKYGDYYTKPTMFYFYNYEPTFFSLNFLSENNSLNTRITNVSNQIARSLMHPTFAHNFIHKYILGF